MNKRLRKKLHEGEFTLYGFELAILFKTPVTNESMLVLLDAAIEKLGVFLSVGWKLNGLRVDGFAYAHCGCRDCIKTPTALVRQPMDTLKRKIVTAWLEALPEVQTVYAGPLFDIHGPCDRDGRDLAAREFVLTADRYLGNPDNDPRCPKCGDKVWTEGRSDGVYRGCQFCLWQEKRS
jgi:uncharacterized protein YggL (DUF469 family)